MKKINAEKQKIEKERKTINRQNGKKKDDSALVDKLHKEIDSLKEELKEKDSHVSIIF